MFAQRGIDATLDDIAREAGVGTGTAYRHFPNKKVIAAEILADATQQIATDAEDALRVDDPWDAIVAFFEKTAARLATDRGLYQSLPGRAMSTTRPASGHTSSMASPGCSTEPRKPG